VLHRAALRPGDDARPLDGCQRGLARAKAQGTKLGRRAVRVTARTPNGL
jgi:hypothetical protein